MELKRFSTRYNVMPIHSILSFAQINGGMNQNCKDVYFIRGLGQNQAYLEEIARMDRELALGEQQGHGKYIRRKELPRLAEKEEIEYYAGCFDKWKDSGYREVDLQGIKGNNGQKEVLGDAYRKVLEQFRRTSPNSTASIEKNFMVKLMFWTGQAAGKFLCEWDARLKAKFVYTGTIKKQEYLFFYFMTLLGIDVLLLSQAEEVQVDFGLLKLSEPMELGRRKPVEIPDYDPSAYQLENKKPGETGAGIMPKVIVPPKKKEIRKRETGNISSGRQNQEKRELEFEELALLASSVVMISIHNRSGKVEGTGSGIMIGKKGYILTNNHVINGGRYFSVRMENEEKIYKTDEVIKYNSVLDLALIRIERQLSPIPVYRGSRPLVRGQRVVAIGSPLGLFNSVSDGIISGFRNLDDVDMIQFTAPISHGSSGGALLNMNGEVIGISTAGFDSGQNLNLAVDYQSILQFTRGFS